MNRERTDLVDAADKTLVQKQAVRFGQDLPEPFVGGSNEPREMTLYVLDVVEAVCQGVVDVDDNDLPVSLALIEKCHNSEDLDLLDLADITNLLANLADIEGVIVAVGLGLSVHDRGGGSSCGRSAAYYA
jgi:hypothetical protein